ncbi:MAG: hypothetical protein ACTSRP_19045 [Candidatus Helarchaeota archaeon]
MNVGGPDFSATINKSKDKRVFIFWQLSKKNILPKERETSMFFILTCINHGEEQFNDN